MSTSLKAQEEVGSLEVPSLENNDAEFGGPEARKTLEKKLLFKLDLRMFILIIIYILNYIDRNNAAAARLRGFEKDLGLEGTQFATILSILYVGYIIMQVPSNMFLNYIGKPSIYLPVCMAIWGVLSILTGITTDFVGALLTRFFLGFVEAAFFPGALFLLSKWYKRSELSLRTAILSCGSLLSNAFGALIASGILDTMEGKLGHAAWSYMCYLHPPRLPRWLSPEEIALAKKRVVEDTGLAEQSTVDTTTTKHDDTGFLSQHSGLYLTFTDWKVWWMALALTSMVVSLSFNAFFPTLSATLGYDRTRTLLLCAPPWIFATIVALFNSRHSDRTGERCWHIVVPLFFGLVGFVIAISTMNTAARYVSLFLMAQSYAGFISFLAWISNTFARPASKRAVSLAFINAFSQLGNIAGSYVWPSGWGPTYRYSYAICISTNALTIIMCFAFRQHLTFLNKRAEEKEEETGVRQFKYIL
ncbi:hypothetical protein ONZ45_g15708 [Pleurotus djamor]|nr:hypothetical protein ONZ45_g15708 [Pleurotus djamor]